MAKLSSINKNNRRKAMVKKFAPKFAALKAIAADESRDETERAAAQRDPGPRSQPLRAHRPQPRVLSQVQAEPHHAAGAGQQGPDPRRHEVELVTAYVDDRSPG